MGSGTANVEVLILGKNSVGIDVDPFSKMLSRVKTTILPSREVASVWKDLRLHVNAYVEPNHLRGIPAFPYRDNWFQQFMLKPIISHKNRN